MKVRANLTGYRNAVLGLPVKVYRDLKAGKEAEVPEALIKKYPDLFFNKVPSAKEEVKDGNRKQQLSSK